MKAMVITGGVIVACLLAWFGLWEVNNFLSMCSTIGLGSAMLIHGGSWFAVFIIGALLVGDGR